MKPAEFDTTLQTSLDGVIPSRTRQAMEYSLMAGGKRIRPRLLLAALEDYGLNPELGIPAGQAIEMIHTYSLIHDDLPAMDNDDLRRGRPTCHKAFDEATAILAGDGLLTQAFLRVLDSDASAQQKADLCAALAKRAGASGMIYGQDLDMQAENTSGSPELLQAIDLYKTGQLLILPLECAAILAGRREDLPLLEQIGADLGEAFQIQDDILDVTASAEQLGKSNSDARNQKMTAISLYGLEESRQKVLDLKARIDSSIRQVFCHPHQTMALMEEIFNRSN